MAIRSCSPVSLADSRRSSGSLIPMGRAPEWSPTTSMFRLQPAYLPPQIRLGSVTTVICTGPECTTGGSQSGCRKSASDRPDLTATPAHGHPSGSRPLSTAIVDGMSPVARMLRADDLTEGGSDEPGPSRHRVANPASLIPRDRHEFYSPPIVRRSKQCSDSTSGPRELSATARSSGSR